MGNAQFFNVLLISKDTVYTYGDELLIVVEVHIANSILDN